MGARRHWTRFALCAAIAGCAAERAQESATTGRDNYPGKCWLVGIDEVEAPADKDPDSVALVAHYRFGEGTQTGSPLGLQFQIARARKHDLMQHLQAHSNVVCNPPRRVSPEQGSSPQAASVEVPPFEGQRGQPVP